MSLMTPLLLASAERTLNHLLARDPAAPARLAGLAGKRLLLRITAPAFEVLITFHNGGLALTRLPDASPGDADACVEIDADTLGALMGGASIESCMTANRLIVHGELGLLAATRALLMDLDVDWEGALAEWFGDVPAHSLATGLRRVGRFGIRSSHSLEEDLREYILEEGRWLAGRNQLDIAREHLTELEIATDRLEARLERLGRRLRGGSGS
ncbi:ubiquinone biosynthesis protein UbiJ [Kushneria sinocarnis]|uniref:Ubiquinone biosynthesis accessory factor UbiJ n=2 Tax=Kushneria sinocarnis TaxID=595502 RepID=A0A420WXJ1_9GAMM|nr:SCP2 sterol-binding domain-containing protein [Kushneria sinocarnis]RKR04413.1 ubiquinone biosynthesis protein UbiJ [Kushneria sinocarnis]